VGGLSYLEAGGFACLHPDYERREMTSQYEIQDNLATQYTNSITKAGLWDASLQEIADHLRCEYPAMVAPTIAARRFVRATRGD
jgi:hypothetical protein